ncbi:hypothetical protein INT43_005287 [Umbelopsis isabellina]|uniref:Uncharacterized protein n=1 Tax=Mortierella isabellina TaxID=91625 RepID=A0A8H7PH41_MORIS|nr:hypothetical protein INT43_005287 [Umbelopsis isabellina]
MSLSATITPKNKAILQGLLKFSLKTSRAWTMRADAVAHARENTESVLAEAFSRPTGIGKDARYVLITEEENTVIVLEYDAKIGTSVFEQSVGTLPTNFTKDSYGGEIRISQDWTTLYVCNRVLFLIKALQDIGSAGQFPRGLNIDTEAKLVYSRNQNSNTISVFKIESEGKLPLSAAINHPSPSDFQFGPSHYPL